MRRDDFTAAQRRDRVCAEMISSLRTRWQMAQHGRNCYAEEADLALLPQFLISKLSINLYLAFTKPKYYERDYLSEL